jgi:hypothetical protein
LGGFQGEEGCQVCWCAEPCGGRRDRVAVLGQERLYLLHGSGHGAAGDAEECGEEVVGAGAPGPEPVATALLGPATPADPVVLPGPHEAIDHRDRGCPHSLKTDPSHEPGNWHSRLLLLRDRC